MHNNSVGCVYYIYMINVLSMFHSSKIYFIDVDQYVELEVVGLIVQHQ